MAAIRTVRSRKPLVTIPSWKIMMKISTYLPFLILIMSALSCKNSEDNPTHNIQNTIEPKDTLQITSELFYDAFTYIENQKFLVENGLTVNEESKVKLNFGDKNSSIFPEIDFAFLSQSECLSITKLDDQTFSFYVKDSCEILHFDGEREVLYSLFAIPKKDVVICEDGSIVSQYPDTLFISNFGYSVQ